jgi:osmotically-inducible protein OsmY
MNNIKKTMLGSCVALVLAASSAWAADSTMGSTIDDASLTAKVKSTLIENPATKARQINVETKGGVVQLNGFVDTLAAKSAAENAAMSVAGVVSVDNNLEVKSGARTAGAVIDDGAITAKVKTALIADSRTKAHQIEVKSNKGIVTLGGFVASAAEKEAAGNITEGVAGVVKVENGIKVGKL